MHVRFEMEADSSSVAVGGEGEGGGAPMPTLSVNTKRGQSLDASKLHTCVTRDCEVLRITCDIRAIDMRVFTTSTNITSLTCPDCQVKRQSCGGHQALSHLSIRAAKK